MSALMNKLADAGISPEDLEKAASVHLFQKVAADQGVDLSEYSGDQVNAMYDDFETNILPTMGREASVEEKLAGLTDDDVIELFAKQADAEGIDLDAFTSEKVASMYGDFTERVLPDMAANNFEPVFYEVDDSSVKVADVEEAQAKLAEADILGRRMAQSFYDESQKLAASDPHDWVPRAPGARARVNHAMETIAKETGEAAPGAAPGVGKRIAGAWRGLGTGGKAAVVGTGLTAAGLTAYGAKKLYDRSNGREATASAPMFEALAIDRANEIIDAGGIDKQASSEFDFALDERACEMLYDSGYTFQ